MKTNEELLALIKQHLDEGFGNLWDALTPEERQKVFRELDLISEYLSITW